MKDAGIFLAKALTIALAVAVGVIAGGVGLSELGVLKDEGTSVQVDAPTFPSSMKVTLRCPDQFSFSSSCAP